ncbi:hypothetical protein GUJ93_ZPchr0001g32692 [Zizania palustris]|uniref:Uncharacterized protein n=1 Tax=Zizania palustris TaxID=103762 RepID=A0A8J5RPX1_ZIZPA|nr:hypothetical protein GUJ93_ZPchr0001g32692 [Zizania palustris]
MYSSAERDALPETIKLMEEQHAQQPELQQRGGRTGEEAQVYNSGRPPVRWPATERNSTSCMTKLCTFAFVSTFRS